MIANMSGGDISLIVLAAFWGLLVLFLALVLLTMFRVLESTKLLIDGIRQETVPLLGEVKTTVSGVNREPPPFSGLSREPRNCTESAMISIDWRLLPCWSCHSRHSNRPSMATGRPFLRYVAQFSP